MVFGKIFFGNLQNWFRRGQSKAVDLLIEHREGAGVHCNYQKSWLKYASLVETMSTVFLPDAST